MEKVGLIQVVEEVQMTQGVDEVQMTQTVVVDPKMVLVSKVDRISPAYSLILEMEVLTPYYYLH